MSKTGKRRFALPLLLALAPLLPGCALVEMSGKMTRVTGEVMTDYSKQNQGVIGKLAGFGGSINTAVGSTVEGMARRGVDPEQGKVEQLGTASGQVFDAAAQAARPKQNADEKRGDNTTFSNPGSATPANQVLQAQTRLTQLGYQPGPADGKLGRKTVEAVKRFQQDRGLPASATLDDATVAALLGGR